MIDNQISEEEAVEKILSPFREFMQANVRDKDLQLFEQLAKRQWPDRAGGRVPANQQQGPSIADGPSARALRVMIPAFMVSELRRGFEIGFLIVLPFLIIDLIVSTLVMSMGMMMFPPTVLSLPFKVLFFVLIDGWNLIVGDLVRSFAV